VRKTNIANVNEKHCHRLISFKYVSVKLVCFFSQHRVIYYLTLLLGHSPAMSQRLVPLFTVSIYTYVANICK